MKILLRVFGIAFFGLLFFLIFSELQSPKKAQSGPTCAVFTPDGTTTVKQGDRIAVLGTGFGPTLSYPVHLIGNFGVPDYSVDSFVIQSGTAYAASPYIPSNAQPGGYSVVIQNVEGIGNVHCTPQLNVIANIIPCNYSFSPQSVVSGGSINVNITSAATANTFRASINPAGNIGTRTSPGSITLTAPQTPGNYLVAAADITQSPAVLCSGSPNLTVTLPPASCSLSTSASPAGSTIIVYASNLIPGDHDIYIQNVFAGARLVIGKINGASASVTIPKNLQPGTYGIFIYTDPNNTLSVRCSPAAFDVQPPIVPDCSIFPRSSAIGGQITVSGNNFDPGGHQVTLVTGFGTDPVVLGTFSGTPVTFTIPVVKTGSYAILIDDNGSPINCGPLNIDPPYAACSFTPPNLTTGQVPFAITVNGAGFIAGSHKIEMLNAFLSPPAPYELGYYEGRPVTVNIPSVQGGIWVIRIIYGDPIVCGSLGISGPPVTCTVSGTFALGKQITIDAQNVTKDYPVEMIDPFGLRTIPLGTIRGATLTLTIPEEVPAGTYRIRIDLGAGNFAYCTPDPVNIKATAGNCIVNPSVGLKAGDSFNVASVDFPIGSFPVTLVSGFGVISVNLGIFDVPSTGVATATFTVPAMQGGTYVVRIDLGAGNKFDCSPPIGVIGTTSSPPPTTPPSLCGGLKVPGGEYVIGPITQCDITTPGSLVTKILPYFLSLIGFLSIIVIIISGIQFITSSGNPEGAAAARARLTFAIIGFVIVILAFAILEIVDRFILGKTGIV